MARATLEIKLAAQAPEGALTFAEGRRLTFSGWTELASAIEEFRSSARSPRSGDDGGGEPTQEERVP